MRTFTLLYSYVGEICQETQVREDLMPGKIVENEPGDRQRVANWARFATRGDIYRMKKVAIVCESPKELSEKDKQEKRALDAKAERLSRAIRRAS